MNYFDIESEEAIMVLYSLVRDFLLKLRFTVTLNLNSLLCRLSSSTLLLFGDLLIIHVNIVGLILF